MPGKCQRPRPAARPRPVPRKKMRQVFRQQTCTKRLQQERGRSNCEESSKLQIPNSKETPSSKGKRRNTRSRTTQGTDTSVSALQTLRDFRYAGTNAVLSITCGATYPNISCRLERGRGSEPV